jgi:hypothetical protein
MNKTYIRKSVKGYYISLDNELPATAYEIGSTYQDFLENKWVLLSAAQVKFHEDNPSASVREVLDMQLTPQPERTLEQAKSEKIAQIEEYDSSDAVNSFNIVKDGETIQDWFTPDKRSNHKNSIDSAETLGKETLIVPINGIKEPVTLPVQLAKRMLAQIQLYADACAIVTQQHIAAVEELDTIEAVDAYDYEADYPEKPTFNL